MKVFNILLYEPYSQSLNNPEEILRSPYPNKLDFILLIWIL